MNRAVAGQSNSTLPSRRIIDTTPYRFDPRMFLRIRGTDSVVVDRVAPETICGNNFRWVFGQRRRYIFFGQRRAMIARLQR